MLKHTLLCLLAYALVCCAAAAETVPPMPTPPPALQSFTADLVLYYNPDGGQKYHLDPSCPSVHTRYLPLSGQLIYARLTGEPYAALQPCAFCGAPQPPVTEAPVIDMPAAADYLPAPFSVTTWRGDSFRTNAAVGTLPEAPAGLALVWQTETGVRPGSGGFPDAGFSWYSQPAIVKWPVEVRRSMALTEEARNTTALKEVIFASLDGSIHFLNLADGTATREAIAVGQPMLGAVTLHPLAYPLLMAGQYVRPSVTTGSGLRWYDLTDGGLLHAFDGRVGEDLSGAFNTSALIDRSTGAALALSKDGYLYLQPMQPGFLATGSRELSMAVSFNPPFWTKLTDGSETVTSAPVAYGSRLWFGTSRGRILCADAVTKERLWSAQPSAQGGVINSLAMELTDDGHLLLYAGVSTNAGTQPIPMQLTCLDADTGESLWTCKAFDDLGLFYAGALAACAVGENALDELVFFTLSNVRTDGRRSPGLVLALDKATGGIRWQHEMPGECRSAPVAVYKADGHGWIVQTDEDGCVVLLDGLTGKRVASLLLEGGRWSSPAVFGDMLVIGSCVYVDALPAGGCIYGVRLTGSETTE